MSVLLSIALLVSGVVASGVECQGWSVEPLIQFSRVAASEGMDLTQPERNWLRVSNAMSVGLGAQIQTGEPWLALRVTVSRTIGAGLEEGVVVGASSCGEQCFRLLLEERPLNVDASLVVASFSVLARAPRLLGPLTPYIMAGPSLKRVGLSPPGTTGVGGSLGPGTESFSGWHVGLGVEAAVRGIVLGLEASGHGDLRDDPAATLTPGALVGPYTPGSSHDDFFATLIVRLPIA